MSKDFWKGQRFLPLLITQFFGAFNDNLFKNTLMTFIAYKMLASEQVISIYANVVAGIFILPYFLFSAFAGMLADKYSRSQIARILKITELLLMIGAGFAFSGQSVWVMIVILFFMGLQSTLFGPIKYALLPQLLQSEELVAGNAYVEASTYISIIFGSVLGTVLPTEISLVMLVVCAAVGIWSAYKIPNLEGVQPKLKLHYNVIKQITENIRLIRSHVIVYRTIIGATWFWILGTFFLTELFPLCSKVFNTEPQVVTLFLILFSVGVGAGSVFCNKLLKGEVSVVYVPLSAVGLSICAFCIYILSVGFVTPQNPLTLGQFILLPRGFCLALFLFAFAFCGGMYIVPLNALMQKKAPAKYVASVIAGNNIINSLGMAAISVFAAILVACGFKITDLFLFIAIISAGVAFYICRLLPDALVRSIFCAILNLFFRVKVIGGENLRKAGSKALIVANHVSLLDGLLIAAYLPRKITFAIDGAWGAKWYVQMFSGLVDFYPLNPTNPMSIRSLIEVINQGKTVMIFPEGRISVTGSLMKVYEGAGVVAQNSGAPIVPLRIDGAQYSKFSYLGNLIKTQMFPKIELSILPACKIELPENLSARERRHLTSLKLHDIMAEMIYQTSDKNIPLFNSLLQAERIYGSNHKIALDISKKTLTYARFLRAAYVLGTAYAKAFPSEEKIGLFLPNSLANAISFFALQAAQKVPVMLNFSLGEKQFASCVKTVGLKVVITAHKFIEQGKLEHLEKSLLEQGCQVLYLEDFAQKISLCSKLQAIMTYLWRRPLSVDAEKPAVVLFTSGSEGLPKAVLLSHRNLQANVLQLHLAVPFNSRDVILNALPMFHSFGLTVGTILPLFYGVKTYFYPSPLHYRIIPEVVYDLQATAILGTDTFLYGYGRMAHEYDFFSVRFAVVGGEKLKERTSALWMKKFGVRILEGYGTTETSPVISVNTPIFYKEGTVGRMLPHMQYKLQKITGVEQGKRLLVNGDNVMVGYIYADNPQVVIASEQWYDTGDVVQIDADGFISIEGRAKRFAKVGGEMISLTAVEQEIDNLYPHAIHGVLAVADERKGEKLVLLTSQQNLQVGELQAAFKQHGLSELWVPREIVYMSKPPLLASGKFDYQLANAILHKTQERMGNASRKP